MMPLYRDARCAMGGVRRHAIQNERLELLPLATILMATLAAGAGALVND